MKNELAFKPPQSQDLESIVLGSMIYDKNCIEEVTPILVADDFYLHKNKLIFKAILELNSEHGKVDIMTVIEKLKKMGEIENVGGMMDVVQLTNRIASTANVEVHARIIKQHSIRRKLIYLSSEAIKMSYDDTHDVFDTISLLEKGYAEINNQVSIGKIETVGSAFKQILADWETRKATKSVITGVPSGFRSLDLLTGGFGKQNMITLAARPGMGKTTVLLQMAKNATDYGKKIGIITLEMSAKELTSKLLSAQTFVDYKRILKQYPSDEEHALINERLGGLINSKIFMVDRPSMTDREFVIECRKLVREHQVDMIFLDYLQLMKCHDKQGTREQEVSTLSRTVKSTAKHLDIPIMALSQLSRSVETRGGDKKPMLSDLRESGAIEQDSDMVIFVYRPEYYGLERDSEGNSTSGLMELMVEKHRGGSTEDIKLECDMRYSIVKDKQVEQMHQSFTEYDNRPMKSKLWNNDKAPF